MDDIILISNINDFIFCPVPYIFIICMGVKIS